MVPDQNFDLGVIRKKRSLQTKQSGAAPVCLLVTATYTHSHSQSPAASASDALAALVRAYPDFLERTEANDLVWKDGTRMRIDDGAGAKSSMR